jgi:glutamine amidotransferase
MKAAIINYGAGNLHSIAKAVEVCGFEITITPSIAEALEANVVVLPGVGAFGLAAEALAPERELLQSALKKGFPCVGVCLGMQLLFDSSEEGEGKGVGFLKGRVNRLASERAPQIGWNTVTPEQASADLFEGFNLAYYANTYVCAPEDRSVIIARTEYEGESFPAAIRSANTAGVQFHPEKSSRAGVELLARLLREVTK